MAVVGMDHPLYSAGPTKVTEILYRTFAKRTLGSLKGRNAVVWEFRASY